MLIGVGIVVLVILVVVVVKPEGDTPNEGQMEEKDDGATSLKVPAPGHDGVDEMIVEDGEEMMDSDSADEGSESGDVMVSNHTVSMESSGFNPRTITIKKGDTVTWANNDSKGHWPASNLHPVHAELPGFDALGEVAPGGTYSYTFTQVGSWAMHDHRRPLDGGTIIVQ